MNWLQEYKALIQQLAQVQVNAMELEDVERLGDELVEVFAPLRDGTVDQGDLEMITNAYWDRYGSREIEVAKEEVALHRQLAPVYEHLEHAPEEDWSLFARLRVETRVAGQIGLLRQLLVETVKD